MEPNKFNDPSKSGNKYGGMINGNVTPQNNGRTPVNPEAVSKMEIRVETQSASASVKGFTPKNATAGM